MDSVITLRVSHSHLFPGAVLRLPEGQPYPAVPAECLLLFSDESEAEAEIIPDHSTDTAAGRLLVSAYTTGAGTAIDAKNWHLTATAPSELKVTRRTDDG
ncbi:hypothetical protein [Corynebacterium glyciniphilum]|uniref:hypothetical protein n=1 Tax=Corynebacterium glyciniphilum TaxID=1404244 RepID=UPI0011AB363F|nr:hypothetical protein [Corynebacterium glyciniphilum]